MPNTPKQREELPKDIEEMLVKKLTHGKYIGDSGSNVLKYGYVSEILPVITELLASQRKTVIEEVRENIIGEDELVTVDCPEECSYSAVRNEFRADQRDLLTSLEKESEKNEKFIMQIIWASGK